MKGSHHVVDPRLSKPLLTLHAALDMNAFWRASQRVLEAAMPSFFIGAWFQLSPATPMFVIRNRLPNPAPDWFPDYMDLHPVPPYVAAHPGVKFVRTCDVFPDERDLLRDPFYRQFMKPEGWKYSCGIIFYRRREVLGILGICRTPEQGEFTAVEMRLLRELYPYFVVALRRVGDRERERARRATFEKFLRRLPLPTLLLNWNLRVVYENHAARESCAVWLSAPGTLTMKSEKTIVPPEILDECKRLKGQWQGAQTNHRPPSLPGQIIHHRRRPRLMANIEIQQLSAAAIARPHFLIQLEDHRKIPTTSRDRKSPNLPRLARLTARECEVAALVREGCSNQEIADHRGCSLPTVKKQLTAVFQKLEVPSRSRLIALLR